MTRLAVLSIGLWLASWTAFAQTPAATPETTGKADVDVPATWLKKPTGDDLNAVWPKKALEEGKSGRGVIRCIGTTAGVLTACQVKEESPPGYGFGGAALLLSPSFLFKPATHNGVAVASEVTVPIIFKNNRPVGLMGGQEMSVTAWYPWIKAPDAAAVRAAYPAARAGGAHGHVVLRCGFSAEVALKDCDVVTEAPRGLGFARAALALSKGFQGRPSLLKPKDLEATYINLAIDLPPPTPEGTTSYINEPDWTRSLNAIHAAALFPAKAADARINTGKAVVDCLIDPTGSLTQCQVVGESPEGMNFGLSALTAAAVMKVNLWTRDGAPTPGAHIKLPITLVYAGDDKAAAPTAKPAPAG